MRGLGFGCALLVGLIAAPWGSVAFATADPTPPATQLAELYRPYIGVQTQASPCAPGEAYLPTDALESIHRPEVTLRDSAGRILAAAPTAADLAAAPQNAYIDYPGNALAPGCDYERWFRAAGPPPPAVYGRVLTDPAHPGYIVVQYWMYWIFNDWNNNHEGDWEMMQVIFKSDSVQAALKTPPITVVVAQHEGAQQAAWGGVQRRDGRPVVYPAQGSHATFLSQARWLGKSAEAGFGCDDTRAPSTILDPTVIMLPDKVDPASEFAWVNWQGRWGERQPFFNNGSTGPVVKPQWTAPITWTDNIARTASLQAPDFGNAATDFFCSATERGSVLMLKLLDKPPLVGALLLVAIAGVVLLSRRTTWSPRVLSPVATRRRSGQMLSSAAGLLYNQRRRFAAIGAFVLAGGIVAGAVRRLLLSIPSVGDADLLMSGDAFSRALLAILAGSVITIPVAIVAVSLSMAVARDLDESDERRSVRDLLRHRALGPVIAIVALAIILLGPLSFLVGAYLCTVWAAAPSIALRHGGVRSSLRASAKLTKGRRWRIAGLLLVTVGGAFIAGPLLATLVLIATGISFSVVNVLSSLITAALIPWVAIVLVMLHGDLNARCETTTEPRDRMTAPSMTIDQ